MTHPTPGDVSAYWDDAATTFDDEPDHGLRDAGVRAAWSELLADLLPDPPSRVADLGCGTGSLAVLLAASGHRVSGVIISAAMVATAERKAAAASEELGVGLQLDLQVGDVSAPPLPPSSYDAVLARHVVWALPEPPVALATWASLLAPGGRMVLVEGLWSTGSGVPVDRLTAWLSQTPGLGVVRARSLPDPAYWGGPITDERYVVWADALPDKEID